MLPQSKARIFPAAERPAVETDKYRSYNNLHAGADYNSGTITACDEVTLAGLETAVIPALQGNSGVVIPLVGTLHFENADDDNLVNPGQALFLSSETTITNPYPTGLVNYLLILWQSNGSNFQAISSFDIDGEKNSLLKINGDDKLPVIRIGKFDGRKELLQSLQSKQHGVFVHVITGAFEVQYRLLEAKDSLFVWDTETLDLEALSNEAIILLIETPLTALEV